MKTILLIWIFLIVTGTSCLANCAESESAFSDKFNLTTNKNNGEIGFGLETATIQSPNTSLLGIGPRISLDWQLQNNFSINPAFSMVASTSGSFIYSGISGFIRYTFSGHLPTMTQSLSKDGVPVVEQSVGRSKRWFAGFGGEQLLLNGTASVYPAAGLAFSVGRTTQIWQKPIEITGRYSNLKANNTVLTSLFVDISILLGL